MRACSKAGCLLLLTALGSDLAAAEGTSGQVVFGTADLPKDLSPLGMFYSADVIVKGVILSLIFASILTWTIALVKAIEITRARLSLRKSLALLSGAPSMPDSAGTLAALKGGAARLVATALDELRHSPAQAPSGGIKERVAARLQRLEHAEARRINRATGILATIGATGPFVGLFGTVWGIMNSFIGISKAHTTNLAVVAPGIAEALLATAIGLIAAIPAVVLYNLLTRGVAAYRADLGDASTQVQALLSRDLDRRPSSQAAKLQAAE